MPEKVTQKAFANALMFAVMAFFLAACAAEPTPRKFDAGEPLPDNQIARISVEVKERNGRQPDIYITHIDHQPLGGAWSGGLLNKVIDLQPGDRFISMAWTSLGGANPSPLGALGSVIVATVELDRQTREARLKSGYGKELELSAQAGHNYIVRCYEKRLPLNCWIEDEATGGIVSGDKRPPLSEDFE